MAPAENGIHVRKSSARKRSSRKRPSRAVTCQPVDGLPLFDLSAGNQPSIRLATLAIPADCPVGPTPLETADEMIADVAAADVAAADVAATEAGPTPLETPAEIVAEASAAAIQAPKPPKAKRPAGPVFWTAAKDGEMTRLWLANAHHKLIATLIGSTPSAVASRAHRLGLPQRPRSALITSADLLPVAGAEAGVFVAATAAAGPTALETPAEVESRAVTKASETASRPARSTAAKPQGRKTACSQLRRCMMTGVMFWSRHPGERISPAAKESEAYRHGAALADAW
jgi:hypothetical protein